MSYNTALSKESITLTPTTEDLVGKIWTTGRPKEPDSPINALPMKFAGRISSLCYTFIQRLSKSVVSSQQLS